MLTSADIVSSYYRDVLRFVRRRVRSSADAEDVTQEVFLSAFRALEEQPASTPTLGWLYTVARRRLADEARRRKLTVVSLEESAEPEAPSTEYGDRVSKVLQEAIANLPEAQRAVVLMRLVEGRKFAEIAARLQLTDEAARMRFMRALETLRIQLQKEGLKP